MAKVNWTFQAMEDLTEIDLYLNQKSHKYAEFVIDEILKVAELLQQFPSSGRVVPESNISSIREIIIHRYRVIYHVNGSTDLVSILSVRHSAKPLSFLK